MIIWQVRDSRSAGLQGRRVTGPEVALAAVVAVMVNVYAVSLVRPWTAATACCLNARYAP